MRWPDGLDIGVGASGDRCISVTPRQKYSLSSDLLSRSSAIVRMNCDEKNVQLKLVGKNMCP